MSRASPSPDDKKSRARSPRGARASGKAQAIAAMSVAVSKFNPEERAAAKRSSDRILNSVKTPSFEHAETVDGRSFLKIAGEPHTQDLLALDIFATGDAKFQRSMHSDLAHAFRGQDEIRAGELENALAIVRALKPGNESEALLAVQMAAVHNALIFAAGQLRRAQMLDHQDSAATILNKLARTSAIQFETMKKLRSTGEQVVHVQHQHVTVNDGGQAIVAGQMTPGGGGMKKESDQPHEPSAGRQRSPAMLSAIQTQPAPVPSPSGSRLERVPVSRRTRRSS